MRTLFGDTPLGVGFGIRTKKQVTAVGEHAELAIVGSALVAAIDTAANEASARGEDPTEAGARCARDFLADLGG